jgi:aldehyde dehydrogenase (NAD+)
MMSQNIPSVIEAQHTFFHNGSSRCITFAKAQLKKLKKLLQEHETMLVTALSQDLGKSYVEAYTTELFLVMQEIDHALRNICTWKSVHYVKTPWILKPAHSYVQPEPCGQILIIAPWNYPILLTLMPAIGAIAAGNCLIIKPSEHAPHTSRALRTLLNTHFDPGFLHVIEGDHATVETMLSYRFDHIFFTGSKSGGKRILQSAAQHLTPVTLELGGKCPTIVHHDAHITDATKKSYGQNF